MTKVIILIKSKDRFVESFTKKSMCLTNDINRAGKYSLKVAQKHIGSKKIDAELIPY
jgi:hypothetical protein